MDWGDLLFCLIAALLAGSVFLVSIRLRELTVETRGVRRAIEQLAERP